jgi:deoxyadenosine/deoxycytidine kinase
MTYIVIEGVIGVGKTALTRVLGEQFAVQTLFEKFEENPFLSSFTQ